MLLSFNGPPVPLGCGPFGLAAGFGQDDKKDDSIFSILLLMVGVPVGIALAVWVLSPEYATKKRSREFRARRARA